MIILQKTQVCDLRDVSKISVHPTRDRVVGFVLNDRSSQKRQFLCFKLCKKSRIKVTALILILVYNVCILIMCFRVMSLRDCIKRGFDFIILSQKSGSVYTQKLNSNPPYLLYSVCVCVCIQSSNHFRLQDHNYCRDVQYPWVKLGRSRQAIH